MLDCFVPGNFVYFTSRVVFSRVTYLLLFSEFKSVAKTKRTENLYRQAMTSGLYLSLLHRRSGFFCTHKKVIWAVVGEPFF